MHATTMNPDSYLDPGTEAFLDQFRRGLSKVPNLTGQFDLRSRKLKARGGYALVYEVPWIPPVALPGAPLIQVCYKELLPPAGNAPEQIDIIRKTIRRLTREVWIWKDLNHANIIEFIGYAIEGERSDMKAVLVSKWCVNGDVVEYLRTHPNSDRIQLIREVASGLQYLHSRDPVIIHGDLTPHNVLISDEGTAKLCDFGLSRIVSELSKTGESTTTPGFTIRYSAYEVLDGIKTAKSDIYGFGCTCIHILFSQQPFRGIINGNKLLLAVAQGQSPWEWDETVPLERTLSWCCQLEQESRPSIENVLKELCLIQAPNSARESNPTSLESFVIPSPPPAPRLPFSPLPTPSAQPDTSIYPALSTREPYSGLAYAPFAPFDIVIDMDEPHKFSPPPLPAALVSHDVTRGDWARCMSDGVATWQLNQSRSEKSLQRASIMITTWNAKFFLRRGIHFTLKHVQHLDDDDDPRYPSGTHIGGRNRKRDARGSYFIHAECVLMRGRSGALPSGPTVLGANGPITRQPNPAMSYRPFTPTDIVPDMDQLLEGLPDVPPLPAVLVSHDVTHDDWDTCMKDVVAAWAVRPDSRITELSQRAAVMITTWNSRFFLLRGVHLILHRVQSSDDNNPTRSRAGSHIGQRTRERDTGKSYSLSVDCVLEILGALSDGLNVLGANGPTSRDPDPARSYAPFIPIAIIPNMDHYFAEYTHAPPFPLVLLSHDVTSDDWDSCMRDSLAAFRFSPQSWVTKPSQRVAIVITTWNSEFFHRRGVHVVLEPISTGSRCVGRGIEDWYAEKSYSLSVECISMRGRPGALPGSLVALGANGPISRQPRPNMAYVPFMFFYIARDMGEVLELLPEVPPLPAALVSHDVIHDDWDSYMRDVIAALESNPQSWLTESFQRASIIIATWNVYFFLCRGIYFVLESAQRSESDDDEGHKYPTRSHNWRRIRKQEAEESYSLRVECVPIHD